MARDKGLEEMLSENLAGTPGLTHFAGQLDCWLQRSKMERAKCASAVTPFNPLRTATNGEHEESGNYVS